MRECRRIGRLRRDIPYDGPGGVKELKEYQQRVARGRLIAGYASGYLLEAAPETLLPYLGKWRELLEPHMPMFRFRIGEPPEPPLWVQRLGEL